MRRTLICLFLSAIILPGIVAGDTISAAKRAKAGSFDAMGEVACAQEVGQKMETCAAAVARVGSSEAAVIVTFPNGFARTLMFEDGFFIRGNPTMSGAGTDTDWRISDGMHFVRVDDQRFELPEALVFGE